MEELKREEHFIAMLDEDERKAKEQAKNVQPPKEEADLICSATSQLLQVRVRVGPGPQPIGPATISWICS